MASKGKKKRTKLEPKVIAVSHSCLGPPRQWIITPGFFTLKTSNLNHLAKGLV
jgi:hypothetical protein